MSKENNAAPKKNPVGAIVFIIFVAVLPIVTVLFSKTGLDKYKDIRSEMRYLKDSIRVNFDTLATYQNTALNNKYIRGKLVIAGHWTNYCDQKMPMVINQIKDLKGHLSEDDQEKLLIVIHTDNFSKDSTWAIEPYLNQWKVDTGSWKFTKRGEKARYHMANDVSCSTIALLDGRVSRKDSTNNYLQGPLLCDHYDLNQQIEIEKLLRHMAIIMPAKQRKKIQYRPEEKLYK